MNDPGQQDEEVSAAYVLRALLMHSTAFNVVLGCSYAFTRFPDAVKTALNLAAGHAFAGGSLWIERTASPS